MMSSKGIGRATGVLLLIQLAGLIVPFVMLLPLAAPSPEWLVNAAASATAIKTAVFLLLANCALTLGIAVFTFPLFSGHSIRMALVLAALSVVMLTLQAVDNAHLLGMLSLSQRWSEAGGDTGLFQTIAAAAGSTRKWVHYTELLVIDAWILFFQAILYRFKLVPRPLAVFGIITVLLHLTGIPLPLILGYRSVTLMGASMGVGQIAVAVWLAARGFSDKRVDPGFAPLTAAPPAIAGG